MGTKIDQTIQQRLLEVVHDLIHDINEGKVSYEISETKYTQVVSISKLYDKPKEGGSDES